MMLRHFFLVVISSTFSFGYKSFQNKIPNGDSVPHPCKPNFLWQGVGHENELGGGSRNSFGKDFTAAGMKWTTELCMKDSDGDGRTNGQELGDPNCIWQENSIPETDQGISHPGVCEPYDSDLCRPQNTELNCELESFKCDAIKSSDVKNITLRFQKTRVPDSETNYFCMTFDLPTDGDYHVIATTPAIDNVNVMHHILLYGCDEGKQPMFSKPKSCEMGSASCNTLFGTWGLGATGQCIYKDAGFRIGTNGIKRVMMQMHWNNPELRSDYTDSSGMTLHYTPNLRPNDAAMLMVGQVHLEIPPGSKRYTASSVCDAEDTREIFTGPINIVRGLNHMHYLGREQYIDHFSDGVKVNTITNESTYSYDRPIFHPLPEPVKVQPGDEIKTTCVFKAANKKKTTFMGRGTYDEMCFGFLEVFPAKNLTSRACVNWRSLSMEKLYQKNPYGCNLEVFFNNTQPHFIKVKKNCRPLSKCLEECKKVVKEIREHPCLKGDMGEYMRAKASQRYTEDALHLMSMIQSCDLEFLKDEQQLMYQKMVSDSSSGSGKLQLNISYILFVAFIFMNFY